jgi:hypothetical protein
MASESVWREMILGYRKRYALTQADAAERLQVSQQTISRWESGKQEPEPAAQAILREHLGMVAMNLRESWVQRVTLSFGREYLFDRGWHVVALAQNADEQSMLYSRDDLGKPLFETPMFAPLQTILEDSGLFTGETKLARLKAEFHSPELSEGRIFDFWPILTGTDEILVHGVAYPFEVGAAVADKLDVRVIDWTLVPRSSVSHKTA